MTRVLVDVAAGALGVVVGQLERHECRITGSAALEGDDGLVRLVVEGERIPEPLTGFVCRAQFYSCYRDGTYSQTLTFDPAA